MKIFKAYGLAVVALTVSGCNPQTAFVARAPAVSQLDEAPKACVPVIGEVAPKENLDLRWKHESGPNPSYNQLMTSVMVADINGDKVSDFIFVPYSGSAYTATGVLRVVSGEDGREIWSTGVADNVRPLSNSALAIYDLNRDNSPEIAVMARGAGDAMGMAVYNKSGTLLSFSATPGSGISYLSNIEFSDLKGDGKLVANVGGFLYQFNSVAMALGSLIDSNVLAVMDVVPSSPGLEILKGDGVYSAAGVKLYSYPAALAGGSNVAPIPKSGVAFGNFNKGKRTDIVIKRDTPLTITILNGETGARISEWTESQADRDACLARTSRARSTAGALNVGDLDGDGIPDITFAGACKFYALKAADSSLGELWNFVSRDFSSMVTGSSVYDLNGDGSVEVLYNDELFFRIFDGKTGKKLFEFANDSGTLYEYPVVASLRAGEPASIILAANSYTHYYEAAFPGMKEDPENGITNVTGIRVIQSADKTWMPTRTIWNQYLYMITNVMDDLQVPRSVMDFVGLSNRTRANTPKVSHPCIVPK